MSANSLFKTNKCYKHWFVAVCPCSPIASAIHCLLMHTHTLTRFASTKLAPLSVSVSLRRSVRLMTVRKSVQIPPPLSTESRGPATAIVGGLLNVSNAGGLVDRKYCSPHGGDVAIAASRCGGRRSCARGRTFQCLVDMLVNQRRARTLRAVCPHEIDPLPTDESR